MDKVFCAADRDLPRCTEKTTVANRVLNTKAVTGARKRPAGGRSPVETA